MMEETLNADDPAQPGYGLTGRWPEEVHADTEQDRIQDAWYEYPLPQLMFGDKLVSFAIRLKGYDNFFEQSLFSFTFKRTLKWWNRPRRFSETIEKTLLSEIILAIKKLDNSLDRKSVV